MNCVKCNSSQVRVIDTRAKGTRRIYRRRVCMMCGCRWTTVELPVGDVRCGGGNTPMVVEVLCRASTQGGAESQMNTATTLTTDHDRTIIAHKNEAVALQGNIIDRDAGMNGAGVGEDVCFTLNTVDRHGVAYDTGCLTPGEAQEQRCYSADAPAPTLQSRECGGGQGKSFVQKAGENVQPKYIVRRLMPMECGRLQGFPDGWGEIEQLTADMPEETAAFWRKVYTTDRAIKGKKPQKSTLKKTDKLAAWHNGLHTDSAEYMMWGNGMALPNALFFVQRAVARVAIDTGKGAAKAVRVMQDAQETAPRPGGGVVAGKRRRRRCRADGGAGCRPDAAGGGAGVVLPGVWAGFQAEKRRNGGRLAAGER